MSQSSDRRPGARPQRRFDGPNERGPRRGAGGAPPNRPFSRPGGRPPRPGVARFEPGRERDADRYGSAAGGGGRSERSGGGERRFPEAREGQRFERRGDRPAYGARGTEGRGAEGRGGEGRGAEGRGPQARPSDRRPRRSDARPAFQGRGGGPERFGAERSTPRFGSDRSSAPRFRDGQRRAPFGAAPLRSVRPGPARLGRGDGGGPLGSGLIGSGPGGSSLAGSGLAVSGTEAQERGEVGNFAGAAPSDLIWGRHTAQAVLESGRPIHRVWCTPEMRFSPRFLQLLREAKASGVLVEEVTWARLGQISGGAVHQGIVLQPAAADTLDLASLIEGCSTIGEAPLLLAVDGLTDPQNLGAIVRSAEALGAHGLVLPQRRNAGLTGSVAKVAAGALEHLPIARVVNLNRSLDTLKQEGYRVIGLAGEGNVSLEEADLQGPLVIVTGSEGDGLSLLTRRNCDQLVRIPLRGATPSLNASVATALLLYEVARRSWMKGLTGSSPAPRIVRPALPSPAARGPLALEGEPVAELDPSSGEDPSPAPAKADASTASLDAPPTIEPGSVTEAMAVFALNDSSIAVPAPAASTTNTATGLSSEGDLASDPDSDLASENPLATDLAPDPDAKINSDAEPESAPARVSPTPAPTNQGPAAVDSSEPKDAAMAAAWPASSAAYPTPFNSDIRL